MNIFMWTQKNCACININAQLIALKARILAGSATIFYSKHSSPAIFPLRISAVNTDLHDEELGWYPKAMEKQTFKIPKFQESLSSQLLVGMVCVKGYNK